MPSVSSVFGRCSCLQKICPSPGPSAILLQQQLPPMPFAVTAAAPSQAQRGPAAQLSQHMIPNQEMPSSNPGCGMIDNGCVL